MDNFIKLKLQLFANMDVGTKYISPVINIKPYGYSSDAYSMKFEVKLNSQDILSNTSNITITSYMKTNANAWGWRSFRNIYMERYTKVNDEIGYTLKNSTQLTTLPTDNSGNWVNCGSWTGNIEHNLSGECTLYIQNHLNSSTYSDTSYIPRDTYQTSEELVLKSLHKVPDEISYSFTEINSKLTNANISDNIFVKNLSIKNFSISATTYDEATITKYRVYNNADNNNYFESTTQPFNCDFSLNPLIYDVNNKTKVKIGVFDSMGAEGNVTSGEYDVIPYENITINDALTDVKRIGQVSGNVDINIQGTYYNDIVGSIDQSGTYKPTIKYKYWRTGTTEPSTYDNTIPSSNITINNGIFSVSNYDIGSSTETDPNYFDGKYSYKVKVLVLDNFSEKVSSEKSIFVGEAVWTEHEDCVDFKALTRQDINIYPDLYVLDTDVVIGEFNGKPLYRRVVHPTPTTARSTLNHGIANLKQIVKVYGRFTRDNTVEQQSPIPNNYTNWEIWLYDIVASGTYTLYFSSNQWGQGVKDIYIVFEFTKTTD